MLKKTARGFTLIELMIVVAIIGILAAIAIPNFLRYQLKSKSAEAPSTIGAIRTAETAYYADKGAYLSTTAPWPVVAASVNNTKHDWTNASCTTTPGCQEFDLVGYQAEGAVYFTYAVTSDPATPDQVTIAAVGDLDGDTTQQQWVYAKTSAATGTTEANLAVDPGTQLNSVQKIQWTTGSEPF